MNKLIRIEYARPNARRGFIELSTNGFISALDVDQIAEGLRRTLNKEPSFSKVQETAVKLAKHRKGLNHE